MRFTLIVLVAATVGALLGAVWPFVLLALFG